MIFVLVRLFALGVAIGAVFGAWTGWQVGSPPAWTLFTGSESAVVARAEALAIAVGNGTTRYAPDVAVYWPAGAAEPTRLNVNHSGFHSGSRTRTEEILARYPVGRPAPVRVAGGELFIDNADWMPTALALFWTFLAVVIGGVGLFVAVAPGLARRR